MSCPSLRGIGTGPGWLVIDTYLKPPPNPNSPKNTKNPNPPSPRKHHTNERNNSACTASARAARSWPSGNSRPWRRTPAGSRGAGGSRRAGRSVPFAGLILPRAGICSECLVMGRGSWMVVVVVVVLCHLGPYVWVHPSTHPSRRIDNQSTIPSHTHTPRKPPAATTPTSRRSSTSSSRTWRRTRRRSKGRWRRAPSRYSVYVCLCV